MLNPLIIWSKLTRNLRKNFDTVLPIVQELLENDVNNAGNTPKLDLLLIIKILG